jgi:hypothetical protein
VLVGWRSSSRRPVRAFQANEFAFHDLKPMDGAPQQIFSIRDIQSHIAN